jgi:formiminoglutamase
MYRRTDPTIWQGREDQVDGDLGMRWHQLVKCLDLSAEVFPVAEKKGRNVLILGFQSDEGVKRNHGRTGATEGPNILRKASSNLPVHFSQDQHLLDGGNVACVDGDLDTAQEELTLIIEKAIHNNYFPVVFGGGHEVALPHFLGLARSIPKQEKIGIINLDAHFDLRLPEAGGSSGTPFYQIADWCKDQQRGFRYFCAGIQEISNTQALFQRANELNVGYLTVNDLQQQKPTQIFDSIHAFMASVDNLMLTVCLDVFNQSYAPGVSAPNALGIDPSIASMILQHVIKTGKVRSFDIAELNPAYDPDGRTARLASALVFQVLSDI